ncbi:MAG: CarD family transcriptional regulator, partial [Anaerolineae bacterium]
MGFDVGDKVVHPYHGPGVIIRIEQKEFMESQERYYV